MQHEYNKSVNAQKNTQKARHSNFWQLSSAPMTQAC